MGESRKRLSKELDFLGRFLAPYLAFEYHTDRAGHLIENKRDNRQSVDNTAKLNQSEGISAPAIPEKYYRLPRNYSQSFFRRPQAPRAWKKLLTRDFLPPVIAAFFDFSGVGERKSFGAILECKLHLTFSNVAGLLRKSISYFDSNYLAQN